MWSAFASIALPCVVSSGSLLCCVVLTSLVSCRIAMCCVRYM